MSFRYKAREKDRDERKERVGLTMPRERDREWDKDWDRDWDRGDRGDRDYRDYRERERYRERDPSRERERDYDRPRERDRDRDRERDRDKERDRSQDGRDFNRDRDRYRERDKGSSSRYRRNHGFNNTDEDNSLSNYNAKEGYGSDRNTIQKWDWSCYKCGVNNFKRREQCFKCGTPREESAAAIEIGDEISLNPTNCLILRDLAPQTTEEKILTALEQVTALPIKSIRIPRDPVYGPTRCICFVELHTTLEASQLFTLLCSSNPGFIVDGYPLQVCYAKRNVSSSITPRVSNVASVALAAAQWTNQSEQVQPPMTNTDSTRDPTISAGPSVLGLNPNSSNAQTVANSIESNSDTTSLETVSVNGVLYPKYPAPDTSTYSYDENSGYYYDSANGLYYDANSHYYYNPSTQSYLYWDGNHSTYLPADTKTSSSTSCKVDQTSNPTSESNGKKSEEKTSDCNDKSKEAQDDKSSKQDKVKFAKKIAKDMEKWAKTLNQKKETSRILTQPPLAAFSAPEIEAPVSSSVHSQPSNFISKTSDYISIDEPPKKRRIEYDPTMDSPEQQEDKVAEKPDSEDSSSRSPDQSDTLALLHTREQKLLDWERLLCLLCKRQFNSKEQLTKHQQASDLHKNNLIKLGDSKFVENPYGEAGSSFGDSSYRDRARERRLKYGQPEVPEPDLVQRNSTKTVPVNFTEPKPPTVAAAPSVSGIGTKMLKAMGWSEGQGLGRSKQGTSSIIEVEMRTKGVGLGIKSTTTGVGESYKDAVRRASWLRFQELSKNDS